MNFTMRTHDGALSFFVSGRADGAYVFLESAGHPGTLGRQICEGGGFMGETLRATPATLAQVCRRWRRQQLRRHKA